MKLDKKGTFRSWGVYFIVGAAIGVILAVMFVFLVKPFFAKRDAQSVLDGMSGGISQEIVAINSNPFEFTDSNPLELQTDQWGLGEESLTSPAAFIYGTGKSTVDLYLDFGTQRSRDILLVNKEALEEVLKNGKYTVRIHPVISEASYGLFAAEAVSEVTLLAPEKSWEYLLKAVEGNAVASSNRDDALNHLTNLAVKAGINIDASTIDQGSFASWVLTSGDDIEGKVLPFVLINGEEPSGDITLLDPEEFRKVLKSGL